MDMHYFPNRSIYKECYSNAAQEKYRWQLEYELIAQAFSNV